MTALRGDTAARATPALPVAGTNVVSALVDSAARDPHKSAIIWARRGLRRHVAPYGSIRYDELLADVQARAARNRAAGITPGTRTLLMVPHSPGLAAEFFALLWIGAVPVLLDPRMPRRNLSSCLERVRPQAFVAVPRAHVLRLLVPRALAATRLRLTTSAAPLPRARGTPTFDPAALAPSTPAAILFTSGSTGPAKGVLYEHGMFAAQLHALRSHFGLGPDAVDLATFPLFGLFDLALGMTAVIPDMDAGRPGRADPQKITAAIRDHGCTSMFASPALLTNLTDSLERRPRELPSLRRILTAGAPVPPPLLRRLHDRLGPELAIHTPYGATECLPVSTIESREILEETAAASARGAGTCVGRPLPGLDVRIIEIRDEAIAQWSLARELLAGQIGEIVVRGPVATREYAFDSAATASAKIPTGGPVSDRSEPLGGPVSDRSEPLGGPVSDRSEPLGGPVSDRSVPLGGPVSDRSEPLGGTVSDRSVPLGGPVSDRSMETVTNDSFDTWHRMGDAGYFDTAGRLWFCGRVSQRVTAPGRPLFTDPVEGIFNAHAAVGRSALVGVGPPGRQRPAVWIEPDPARFDGDERRLRDELAALASRHEVARGIDTFLLLRRLPVDTRHNAKIAREQLAALAAERLR